MLRHGCASPEAGRNRRQTAETHARGRSPRFNYFPGTLLGGRKSMADPTGGNLGRAIPRGLPGIDRLDAAPANFWHHHFGKVAAAWALAFLVPFAIAFGPLAAALEKLFTHRGRVPAAVILLAARCSTVGGIHIRGNLHGSPRSEYCRDPRDRRGTRQLHGHHGRL